MIIYPRFYIVGSPPDFEGIREMPFGISSFVIAMRKIDVAFVRRDIWRPLIIDVTRKACYIYVSITEFSCMLGFLYYFKLSSLYKILNLMINTNISNNAVACLVKTLLNLIIRYYICNSDKIFATLPGTSGYFIALKKNTYKVIFPRKYI